MQNLINKIKEEIEQGYYYCYFYGEGLEAALNNDQTASTEEGAILELVADRTEYKKLKTDDERIEAFKRRQLQDETSFEAQCTILDLRDELVLVQKQLIWEQIEAKFKTIGFNKVVELTGLSRDTVNSIKLEHKSYTIDSLLKICNALGIDNISL